MNLGHDMPQRAPPKSYQILLKTHKLTIFLVAHQSSTVASLKEEALSALTSSVLSTPSGDDDPMDEDAEHGQVPRAQSTEDFELCRAIKDKGKSNATSSPPAVLYDTLDPSAPIKGLLSNWETLYVRFKDEDGNLLPVEVSQPSLLDEEEEEPRRVPPVQESPVAIGKGKRKAPPE